MATKTALTEGEYLRTSFDNPDPEFRDGELVERSLPTFNHGETQGDLHACFRALRPKYAVFPCVETRIRIRPGRYLIADVAVFFGSRPPAVPDTPPVIAIEILSPDDHDVLEKLEEYRAWGVLHIWLVDPESPRLYVYDDGLWEVSSFHVPELEFDINSVNLFHNR